MSQSSCSNCAQAECTIAELKLRIADLERRVAELEAANKNLRTQLDEAERNTHRQTMRFPRRKLKKRKKKPGRRLGHPAANRPTPEHIDRIVDAPCKQCPDCKTELTDSSVVVQYQTDLPPIVPVVTQFNIETGFCPCCLKRQRGRHPDQISDAIGAAGNTIGPVALTMAAELKHRLGVPYRKICDFFEVYYDLDVSPATLVRAEKRLTKLAEPTYKLLLDALRQADVVHVDETGWRIGRLNAWLWVFSNQTTTVYAIRRSRGHEVPEEILGPDFDGWLVVDGFLAYTVLDYAKSQCNGHLLRRVKKLETTVPAKELGYMKELSSLLQTAIELAERRAELTEQVYERRVYAIEQRLIGWVLDRPNEYSDELRKLHRHVVNHVSEWLVFLREPNVPPTNNHAERMIRPAVITRKVGGCNKTLLGSVVHGVLASIMTTCKQRGMRFLELAKQLWSKGEPQAIPIPLPVSG
jgi:transposase